MRERLKDFNWHIHGLSEGDIDHIYKMVKKTIEDRNKILDEYKARVEKEDPEMAPDILDDICYYHGLQNLILWQFAARQFLLDRRTIGCPQSTPQGRPPKYPPKGIHHPLGRVAQRIVCVRLRLKKICFSLFRRRRKDPINSLNPVKTPPKLF